MEGEKINKTKPLSALILILVLIAISAFLPARWLGVTPKKQSNDGLEIKKLIKSSELVKDSNKDGKVGWDDVMTSSFADASTTLAELYNEPVDQKSIDELNDPNNLTASFSRNVYMTTAYLKKNNITDEAIKQDSVNTLMEEEASKISVTTYQIKDIRVSKSDSKESIKSYGNAIAPILKNIMSAKQIGDDMNSLQGYIDTKKTSSLTPLTKNKVRLDALLKQLLAIEVPPSAITQHILLLTRVALYRDTVDNMSKLDSDPVRSTIAFGKYQDMLLLLAKLPDQFFSYFNAQNIVFTSVESGYIFTTGFSYQ
jgi:hypothetical protein